MDEQLSGGDDERATERGVQVVTIGEDRADELLEVDRWAFGVPDSEDREVTLRGTEWDRTAGAVLPSGGDGAGAGADAPLAGVYSVRTTRLQVPGGEVPAAGLTWVGVHPQHRRRGVLSSMMEHHLRRVHEAGEPVSVLWAAEPAIYSRYGYGLGALVTRMTLARGAAMRDVPGADALHVAMERADPQRHTALVAQGYEAARQGRPGAVSRDSEGLQHSVLDDPPRDRDGAEALRLLTLRDVSGDLRGYALFRRKEHWGQGGPEGEVRVREAVALDAAAARALWGRLTDLDLTTRVRTDLRASDDALVHLLVDVRAALVTVGDGLWVRLVDVDAALAARRYLRPVDVVLDVTDARCPWNTGTHHLVGGPDGASCAPTRRSADLACDVSALGAAYLGGQTLGALAAAGRVVELTDGALAAAGAGLSWPVAPHCGWEF